jgi:hypothetical protein
MSPSVHGGGSEHSPWAAPTKLNESSGAAYNGRAQKSGAGRLNKLNKRDRPPRADVTHRFFRGPNALDLIAFFPCRIIPPHYSHTLFFFPGRLH